MTISDWGDFKAIFIEASYICKPSLQGLIRVACLDKKGHVGSFQTLVGAMKNNQGILIGDELKIKSLDSIGIARLDIKVLIEITKTTAASQTPVCFKRTSLPTVALLPIEFQLEVLQARVGNCGCR